MFEYFPSMYYIWDSIIVYLNFIHSITKYAIIKFTQSTIANKWVDLLHMNPSFNSPSKYAYPRLLDDVEYCGVEWLKSICKLNQKKNVDNSFSSQECAALKNTFFRPGENKLEQ